MELSILSPILREPLVHFMFIGTAIYALYGAFDLTKINAFSNNMVAIGYDKGAPMGGDLPDAPEGAEPTFLIAALRNPHGANLDRVQIVKGWLDTNGEVHERVYDVAVSDGREIIEGKVTSDVGTTVNLETASYTNTIGEVALTAGWTGPIRNLIPD